MTKIYLAVFDPEGLDFASTDKRKVEEFIDKMKEAGRTGYYDIEEMELDKPRFQIEGVKFD